jgi:hypothetical protein
LDSLLPIPGPIPGGSSRRFSIADICVDFRSTLGEAYRFELPGSFRFFVSPPSETDIEVNLGSRRSLPPVAGPVFWESATNWRMFRNSTELHIEVYHPPSSRTYCRAAVHDGFRRLEVLFDEDTVKWLLSLNPPSAEPTSPLTLPHPLDQLVVVPPLAHRDGFLIHAAGAVVGGKAWVFAGHSGDGKTTLSRLLADEGVELLSDERIALRRQDGGFVAYGTPWPGEGDVVSPAAYPLGGVFLLRKAKQHRVME